MWVKNISSLISFCIFREFGNLQCSFAPPWGRIRYNLNFNCNATISTMLLAAHYHLNVWPKWGVSGCMIYQNQGWWFMSCNRMVVDRSKGIPEHARSEFCRKSRNFLWFHEPYIRKNLFLSILTFLFFSLLIGNSLVFETLIVDRFWRSTSIHGPFFSRLYSEFSYVVKTTLLLKWIKPRTKTIPRPPGEEKEIYLASCLASVQQRNL